MTDVAHLVHGPIACEGNSWDNRGAKSSGSNIWRTGFTTDINETDVVFGGEKRLFKAVKEIIEKYDPPAVFVYQTCVPAMIGDDINAVCKAASQKFGKPVIPVNSPGFVGPKNLGNKLAGEALLEHVIGTEEPEFTTPYDINIIGEYNLGRIVAGEAAAGRTRHSDPLLHLRRRQISRGGVFASRQRGDDGVLEGHDQRGAQDGGALRHPVLRRLVLRHRGFQRFAAGNRPAADRARRARRTDGKDGSGDRPRRGEGVGRDRTLQAALAGKKVLLITGGVKSWSVVAALQEAGLEIVGTSVKKSTKEDKERIKELMGQDAHMIDDMTPREMYKMLKDAKADIMLSGGKSQFVALKAAMPWLDINQERSHAYMGYVGMVKLVEEIDKALFNPVWEQLRRPAPWEQPAKNWQAKAIAQMDAEAAALAADPAAAEKARRAKKICHCKTVDLGTIEDAISAHALTTTDGVKQHTNASGGCGACAGRIEDILAASPAAEISAVPVLEAAE